MSSLMQRQHKSCSTEPSTEEGKFLIETLMEEVKRAFAENMSFRIETTRK